MKRISAVLCVTLLFIAMPLLSDPKPDDATSDSHATALAALTKAAGGRDAVAGFLTILGEREPILGFSVGVSHTRSNTGGGGDAGKAEFGDLVVLKKANKATPILMQACANGTHLPEVTLDVLTAKGTTYMTIKLKNVYITSYQTGGSAGDDPTESLSLNYVELEYILIGL